MDSGLLFNELIRDEGDRAMPYQDQFGNITIGVGRNLTAKGVSKDERYRMAHNDIEEAVALLDQYLPWWHDLSDSRQRVLVNMTFNMGLAPGNQPGKRGVWEFQRMLSALHVGDFDRAAVEMLNSAWARQVGPRAIRLADMMRSGT